MPVAAREIAALQVVDAEQAWTATSPWPDVGMNHGRALCYLFSTMQC